MVGIESPSRQPLGQTPIPGLDPNRHLHLPEWILTDIICISLIYTLHQYICVGHTRVGEEEKFGSTECLEDSEAKETRFERLDSRRRHRRVRICPILAR